MADNTKVYGFRWSTAANGGKSMPSPVRLAYATSQDDQDDASNSIDINVGDPLKLVSTGGVIVALTTNDVSYVAVAFGPRWDGTKMVPARKVNNQTAWGTIEDRRQWVYGVDARAGVWEVDCDDKTTATTFAAYVAFIGENANWVVPGRTATTDADPMLDISSHATTAGLGCRIVGISPTMANQDFSGLYVKLLVRFNEINDAGAVANANLIVGV